MEYVDDAKSICLERDAHRCRHCGTIESVGVIQLVKREGRLAWQLSNLISLCGRCSGERNIVNVNSSRVGIILCGGRGTRLYPITMYQNKHTLPIGLVPMILYPLKTLRKLGVYKVLVVVDRAGADHTINILGSGKEFGMDISYKVQEGAGGISEALYLAKDFIDSSTTEIMCILGDNIFDNDSVDPYLYLDGYYNKACIFLKEVQNPQDYGVAVIENNQVIRIVEKPKELISNLCVVGLYIYPTDVFSVIENIRPSDRGELEISDVNDYYAKNDRMQHRIVRGYWGDAGGSLQRYAECNMYGAKKANVSAEEIDNFRSIVFDDK